MSNWTEPIVIVTAIQAIIAVILGWIAVKQEQARTWRQKKAFLVAQPNKLPQSYPGGGYVIEIHNQGDGEATNVETLIKGKTISESDIVMRVQNNISTIAPRDRITYRLNDNPTVGIDVSVSWTDGTGEKGYYKNKLTMY